MRKQDKYIYTGAFVAASITGLIDIYLQKEKLKINGQKLTWQNYDGLRTLKIMTFSGVAGGFVGNEVYNLEFQKEIKKPFSSDRFLKELINQENTNSDSNKLEELKSINTYVKETLNKELSHQLVNYPEDIGSLPKRTALASTYDSDIVLPIKKENQFGSLSKMSNGIHKIIEDKFGDEAEIIKLRRASSLIFKGNNGLHKIDVIYGREIDNYTTDKKLNLYVRPSSFWQEGTSFKTDINIQKNLLVNKPKVREAIKVLKKYRDKNNLALENVLIEHIALNALASCEYGKECSTTENFLRCMDYMSNKLLKTKILDLANSNNNLLNKIDYPSKQTALNFINNDLSKIKSNPHYVKEIFHQF